MGKPVSTKPFAGLLLCQHAAAVEAALSYGLSKSAQATRPAAWAQWIAFTDANDIRHGDFSGTATAL